jgi:hypothetical protein
MSVGLGETGVYATLATTLACWLALMAERSQMRPGSAILVVLALVSGGIAFQAEHFLARYVALEIAALCVALAPLADVGNGADMRERGRWSLLVYLVLRIGDTGLLVGILALWAGTGTLEIEPALEAGKSLDIAPLYWIAGGLLLAVWVKISAWPMHFWQRAGRLLSLFGRSWLYRTLIPNLGFYLLYRIAPLVLKAPPLRTSTLWGGALGAGLAAILAFGASQEGDDHSRHTGPDGADSSVWGNTVHLDRSLIFVASAQGALALLLTAAGLKATVWLALLALTPLRLLLSLAGNAARTSPGSKSRRVAAVFFAFGSLALLVFDALILWWVWQAGIPLATRILAELALGGLAAWAGVTTLALWQQPVVQETSANARPTVRRWAVLALLAGALLAAWLWREPLLVHLAAASHAASYPWPTAPEALRFLATSPTLWIAFAVAFWIAHERKQGRQGWLASLLSRSMRAGQTSDPSFAMEQGLRRSAQTIHAPIEVGILGWIVTAVGDGTLGLANLAHRWVEGEALEGTARQIAQTAIDSGRLAYQVMEQGGLEGLLRKAVQGVLAGSRWLQRRHTGRLRRNLAWVVGSLALAALGLILFVW